MATIDIDRTTVRELGIGCALAGEDKVLPAAGQVENGWVPNTELACKSAWLTCQGAWHASFSRLASTLTSTGGKLQTVAGIVGSSDQAAADQFRPIPHTEPDSVPGTQGGRHYR